MSEQRIEEAIKILSGLYDSVKESSPPWRALELSQALETAIACMEGYKIFKQRSGKIGKGIHASQ